ncbi:MAG: NADH-quinone oxidoreductase subunit NuoN [Mariprofundales bacterium]
MATLDIPFPVILPLLPEIIVAVAAMAILLWDVFLPEGRKQTISYAALAVCVVVIIAIVNVGGPEPVEAFYGFFVLDAFAIFCKVLIVSATAIAIILSQEYMQKEEHMGEYHVLILFGMMGMMLMVSATNFITMYLGLELMALCTYVLVAYQRASLRSGEAALKYFVLGSLASGILLYGITFIYGVTGSLDLSEIGTAIVQNHDIARNALMVGMVFLLAGLLFKVSAAPFHMWTPDAYEGAPTPVTAFMSVAPKIAVFAILIRVFSDALYGLEHDYQLILSIVAVLTMAVGNLAAIMQTNIKRMLAYSTIGHVGIVLLGLIAATPEGYGSIMTYMTIYLFMNMGAFTIVILMRREGVQGELLDDFAGLATVHKGYALAMGIFLFSLAGIPFFGGFWAKYAVFAAAIQAGHLYLAIIGIIFSVVGAFYYIRLVKIIYFDKPNKEFNMVKSRSMDAIVALTAIAVVYLGIFPNELMAACQALFVG